MHLKKINLPFLFLLYFQLFSAAQDSSAQSLINKNVPKNLHLSHVEINEEFIDFNRLSDPGYRQETKFGNALVNAFDSVPYHYNYPLNLKLPYYLNTLSFHFSAIDWKAPHRIKYSYFLEGHDETWTVPGNHTKAVYRDLKPGNFVFKIKARGESGIWSEPFAYPFKILKPWWWSWWAKVFYALLFSTVACLIFHFWQERKRQEAEIHRLLKAYKLTDFPKAFELKKAPSKSSFLNLVQTTLETHLSDENFGIAELCELLNISRAQLHRKLKSLTGLSTSHYIRSLRLEIAKELLETTESNVSEVAFMVGFNSAAYFSTVFKEQFGCSPSKLK
jgi:AraC-like DNA-binding protein